MRSWSRATALLLACSLLAACTDRGDDEADDTDEVAVESQDDADPEASEEAIDGEEGSAEDSASETEESSSPRSVDLEETETHPSGATVTVTGLTIDDRAVYVDLEAFNPSQEDIRLAESGRYIRLEAPQGRTFDFRPPEDNPDLSVPSGGELTATLGFVGQLSDDDVTLDLLLNWGSQGALNVDREHARFPSFEFRDLPVAGDTSS